MMAHIPNAGMGSVKRKHWKLLETNTLPLGRNHMHLQTNNAKTHTLSQQIESWQTSQCFYTANLNMRQLFTTYEENTSIWLLSAKLQSSVLHFTTICDDFSQRSESEQ